MLVRPDVHSLAVPAQRGSETGARSARSGNLRWLRVGRGNAFHGARSTGARAAGATLDLGIPRDELPHLRERARRAVRRVVLFARRRAVAGCARGAARLWPPVCVVENACYT